MLRANLPLPYPSKTFRGDVMATLIKKLLNLVGPDTLQIFGDTGSGKTTFALEVVKSAVDNGMKAVYIDTERNLRVEDLPEGVEYYYSPFIQEVMAKLSKLPEANLYVLDSLGFPVLANMSLVDMRLKGDLLMKTIALTHYLKVLSYKHNALVLVTNQPQSEFGKPNHTDLPPFGAKSLFGYKEIWRSKILKTSEDETICAICSWRSRRFGRGKELFRIRIRDTGVEVVPRF